jgi:threonine dehydrogenase-like Zn-dependent dehydrogenase
MAQQMTQAPMTLVDAGHPNVQRIAILEEPRRLSLKYAEIPEPGDGELRIKVKWVGVCGSDIESYRGSRRPEFISFPSRLGHEVAGVIDSLGPNIAGLHVGDQVTCRYVWGAFAEYIVCRPFNVKVVPPSLSLLETSLIEILPGVLNAVEIGQIDQKTSVLIMGQGVSGLVLTQVVNLHSPKSLVVTDLNDRNLLLAKKYGATHTYKVPTPHTPTRQVLGGDFPAGFDVVIPCLLEGDGMVDAINCAAFAGKVVMYGCIGTCNVPVDFLAVHRKRLDIYSTEPKRDIDMRRFYDEGVRLTADGLVNTSEMVTHKISLSRIAEAFALRDDCRSDAIHVLIDCEA